MQKATLFIAAMSLSFFSLGQQQPASGIVEYEGNHITMTYEYQVYIVEDPETGEVLEKMVRSEKLNLLNGSKIYQGKEASEPVGGANQDDLQGFIKNLLAPELKDAGLYLAGITVVVDDKGKLGYLKTDIRNSHTASIELGPRNIDAGKKLTITESINKKLHDVAFFPAQKDGKAVPYGIYISLFE